MTRVAKQGRDVSRGKNTAKRHGSSLASPRIASHRDTTCCGAREMLAGELGDGGHRDSLLALADLTQSSPLAGIMVTDGAAYADRVADTWSLAYGKEYLERYRRERMIG